MLVAGERQGGGNAIVREFQGAAARMVLALRNVVRDGLDACDLAQRIPGRHHVLIVHLGAGQD